MVMELVFSEGGCRRSIHLGWDPRTTPKLPFNTRASHLIALEDLLPSLSDHTEELVGRFPHVSSALAIYLLSQVPDLRQFHHAAWAGTLAQALDICKQDPVPR